MAGVRLEGVRKVYGDGAHVAVHGVDLEVRDGEFLVLVGPSGCGKSTTLRMIAGLETITAGHLFIGDRLVNDVSPKDRDIAMVFQSYALYPHMTVYDNLAFALKLRSRPKSEIAERVAEAARILGLEPILDRTPRQLSGGQRQRVAVGRAIVRHPQVFLFDEPLSNLDAKLRVQTRREIARLHRQLAVTMIYVTHDQTEAMTLGDRIVVMNEGRVQQVDTPLAVYDRPANLFVAGFIGSPAMNLIPGRLADRRFIARDDAFMLPLPSRFATRSGDAVLGMRPEHVRVARQAGDPGAVTMRLDTIEPMGSETYLTARAGPFDVTARVEPQALPRPGDPVALVFDMERAHLFDAASGSAF
jgi:multiple sugar transport system ATP-binding protein